MQTENSAHRAEAAAKLSPKGKRFFKLIEFDDSEQLVLEIRKHPFGLLLIIGGGLLLTLVVAFVPMLIAMFADSEEITGGQSTNTIQQILAGVSLLLGLGGLIITLISAILYVNNVILVTTEKVAQILYLSLFNRKISQLSIGDVQDVTVSQRGIFPHLFNYGTLVVETAGEQQNYTFTFVPDPYRSSRSIVGAHEENLKLYGN